MINSARPFVRLSLLAAVSAAVVLSSPPVSAAAASAVPPASTARIPAGDYTLDKAHASLIFKVSHLGFSSFTARFTRFDAKLRFDPARPAAFGRGTLKRSDFGIAYGIPAPGTTMGVGDKVTVVLEAEFNGPPLPGTPASAAAK